ncbi:MAG: methyltransferase domain-containing protein [Archangium sp.]|nr:methyltransferase domain-containing protein [Archangium sp.]
MVPGTSSVLFAPPLTGWQTSDGLHLALDEAGPNWVATDARGARVLSLVDGRKTVGEVAAQARLFEDPARNLQHVTSFLQAVHRAGLLSLAPFERAPYAGRSPKLPSWRLRELWLHTNDSCNLTCTHCLVSSGPAGSHGLPTSALLGYVDEAKGLGIERVFLTGGEPFLRKDLAALVERVTGHHGLELIILTNATLFDHPVYGALLEPMDRSKVRFQVSIDGATAAAHDALRGAGTFTKATAGLAHLSALGFETSLTVVPHRTNLAGLRELPGLARRLGARSIHLMWPHKRGRGLDLLEGFPSVEELLEVTRTLRTLAGEAGVQLDNTQSLRERANAVPGVKHDLGMAGVESLCVGPDGHLYPSAATTGDAALSLGSLEGRTLLEVWQASPLSERLRSATLLDNPRARGEPLRFITGGQDLEHSWFWSGSLTGDDPWAPLITTLMRDELEALARAGRARVHPGVAAAAPLLFHAMGEGALACGDEVPGAVRTLHSNCVLSFDVDRPRALMREFYGAAAVEPKAELCCPVRPSAEDLAHIPREVVDRFYGCGSPVQAAALKKGEVHLDLGSGAGIDVFVAARHVGRTGKSIGVDMTDAMLAVARENQPIVAGKLGFDVVEFHKGVLESVPLPGGHVDCVTSNCVVNLSPDKRAVFAEIFRVLKDHGRLVLADIVADQAVPPHLRVNPQLWGECLSGALTEAELFAELERAGFHGLEVLTRTFWREVEGCTFSSVTVRAWRHQAGQGATTHRAVYRGPWKSVADEQGQLFRRNEPVAVDAATAARLTHAPFSTSFDVFGPDGEPLAKPVTSCC